jgi:hypothetical protein
MYLLPSNFETSSTQMCADPWTADSAPVLFQQGEILVKIAITEYRKLDRAEQSFKDFRAFLTTQEQASARNQHRELHLIKEELSTLGCEE